MFVLVSVEAVQSPARVGSLSWGCSELCLPGAHKGGDSSETISGRSVCTVKTRHENGSVLQPHGRRGSPSKLSSFKQQGSVVLGHTEPLHMTSAEVTHAAVFGDTWLGPSFHKYPPQSVLSLLQDSPASL